MDDSLYLNKRKLPVREKRLNGTAAFYGEAGALLEEIKHGGPSQRIRTFAQETRHDLHYAMKLLASLPDSDMVIHGPRGCGGAERIAGLGTLEGTDWIITNLNERDTIMGSDRKLREAILSLYAKSKPKLIFIVATPVVAINNDDIESVLSELREELDAGLIPVYTDGFSTRLGRSGYDDVQHGLLRQLAAHQEKAESHPPGGGSPVLNLLSVSESAETVRELAQLTARAGFRNNVFPRFSGDKQWKAALRAHISVSIHEDESDYTGHALEERFGIPYVSAPLPIGANGTAEWLSRICGAAGLDTGWIAGQKAKLLEEAPPERLAGLRVYYNLPPAYTFGLAGFLEGMGAETAGMKLPYLDQRHAKLLEEYGGKPDLKLLVGDGQPYEEANLLARLQPDIYIGEGDAVGCAVRLGIPAIDLEQLPALGFEGARRLLKRLEKLRQRPPLGRYLSYGAERGQQPVYQERWLARSVNWHIKQEVK